MNARDSIIEHINQGIKNEPSKMLGLEVEHFIVKKDSGEAVPYAGEGGIEEILTKLINFIPGSEALPGEHLLGFTTPDYVITLEPAAQLEISINASEDIIWIEDTYRNFLVILQCILDMYGYEYLAVGTQPVSKVRELSLIPKPRYYLMNEYFERTGDGGIEMMRGSASAQVSIDYFSEEDYRRKIQAAYYYTPLFKLLSDNSKMFEGEPVNTHLKRTDIWNRTDSRRCGVLPNIFKEDFGFADYADFLLDMPLIFEDTKDGAIPTGDKTVCEIYEGRTPTKEEIVHLMSMAFPDVRTKQYLEIRAADSMPPELDAAYCALIKGLLYSEEGLAFAQEQIAAKHLTEADIKETESILIKSGWEGTIYGEDAESFARKAIAIASDNLDWSEKYAPHDFDKVILSHGITED